VGFVNLLKNTSIN